MRSLDELLEEAKWGQLTDEELTYVVNRIKEKRKKKDRSPDRDLYTLLYILGKSGAVEYRDLVESFLHYPSWPWISSMALRTLVSYWDLMEDYLREIKLFVKGVDWDDDHVRIVAVSAAGRYLTGYQDKELLKLLIDIFVNTNEPDYIRQGAYEALADAVGRDWRDLVGEKEMDLTILDEAIQMLDEKYFFKEIE